MTTDELNELERYGNGTVRRLVAEIRSLRAASSRDLELIQKLEDSRDRLFEREALADERHSILLGEARRDEREACVDKAIALTRSMDEGDGLVDVDRLVRALEDLK